MALGGGSVALSGVLLSIGSGAGGPTGSVDGVVGAVVGGTVGEVDGDVDGGLVMIGPVLVEVDGRRLVDVELEDDVACAWTGRAEVLARTAMAARTTPASVDLLPCQDVDGFWPAGGWGGVTAGPPARTGWRTPGGQAGGRPC